MDMVNDIPRNSRAAKENTYLEPHTVNDKLKIIKSLNKIAEQRGQKLSQMAISWLLKKPEVTSVLVGVSNSEKLIENIKSTEHTDFTNIRIRTN
jgi:L-glyceraldehyde 3-phosphate reductase